MPESHSSSFIPFHFFSCAQGTLPKPTPRLMAKLKAAMYAVSHGPKIIDMCGQEYQLPGGLMVPPGCTLKNGSITLADGAQVSSVLHFSWAQYQAP